MDDPAEHALVLRAFANASGATNYVHGHVEWISDKAIKIARSKLADLDGLTPEAVRLMSIDYVNEGQPLIQSKETRDTWSEFSYKYFIQMPMEGVPWGVYVEFRLNDADPEDPTVHIVSAHRAGV